MSSLKYTKVVCIAEVLNRPLYIVGKEYSSTPSNHGHGPKYWVGIPVQGGHEFIPDEFTKYFK